ncbi:TfoX/Sxy family protein [Candidatus Methanomassiliicoccus intestinalis]|uniref:TfoX/Sxy family protein n=1 Tax=Candidatus Methanomassiliicoccus intestinalis TaxID=1406512 RepID=UPI0037DC9B5E
MGELGNLKNIGKMLEKQLNEVGIMTPDDLYALGSKKAWLRLKAIDDSACYNRLCALEGGIRGIRWHDLPPDVKKDLKQFYEDFHDFE